jgi:hypothetical protein
MSIWKKARLLLSKYDDCYAQSKVSNFAKGFLKYQAKFDPRDLAFEMFFWIS